MNKFDFFKIIDDQTNRRREILQNNIKDFMRILTIVIGVSIFFFNEKIHPITFYGSGVDWYNFFLVINLILLIFFSIITVFSFLFGVNYKGFPQPKDIDVQWEETTVYKSELSKSHKDYGISVAEIVKEEFVKPMILDIQYNDEQNSKLDTKILLLKWLFVGIIVTYIPMMLKVFQL